MIWVNRPGDGQRIAEAANSVFNPAIDQCVARVENGELLGGAIFDTYTGASISGHVAGLVPNWVNRDILFATFHYVFDQLRVTQLFGQVPSNNQRALEFDKKLGFKELVRIPDVFYDADLVVLRMRREDCRWLNYQPVNLEVRYG